MSTLIGRFLTATKNSDGTVKLEFGLGAFPMSQGLTVLTLSSSEVTALGNVLSGVSGTTVTVKHSSENAPVGYHR